MSELAVLRISLHPILPTVPVFMTALAPTVDQVWGRCLMNFISPA